MTDTDSAFLDATAQAELVRNGDASPLELVDDAINRIEKLNPELNAVIHPLFDRGRDAARGELPDGPFRGVPMVLKDLDGTLAGEPCHYGNKLLKEIGYRADVDSYLFEKFRDAGFVFVGKTNTPELGLMPTTEPEAYGPTRNPWHTDHSTGGSSGGSAAAVASGMVPVGHAGDGGGSIRIPSSACGLFGMKPSRGRSSLGPAEGESWAGLVVRFAVTHSVRDSAAMLDAVQGTMPGDPYTAPPPSRPYLQEVGADPGALRIGILTDAPAAMAHTNSECRAAAEDAGRLLESLGHTVEPSCPAALHEDGLLEQFMAVLAAGVGVDFANLAAKAGRPVTPDDVEPLTWAYYEMAQDTTSTMYVEALNKAHAWSRRLASWWADGFDLLLTPTMAEPPAELGFIVAPPDNPLEGAVRALPSAAYTAPFNVSGQPAMSVPLYFAASGLPIGVQFAAAFGGEDLLFRVAAQLETARPWANRRPPIHA